MRTVQDTLQMLRTVSEAVDFRLQHLNQANADPARIARERWRRRLIEETLKAVEETHAQRN
ncbi:MAG: hypothetical protein M5U26_00780 [Planctomycetota bacterium]|nr:hypothetical protein [Planctomycetota bacterium]